MEQEQEINIAELLKDAPKETKLYSPTFGEITYQKTYDNLIDVKTAYGTIRTFYNNGKFSKLGECMLFPSKDCLTWENFKAPWKHKHFEPFQKVLINCCGTWVPSLYGYCTTLDNGVINHVTCSGTYVLDDAIIPYEGNEDKVGTKIKQ